MIRIAMLVGIFLIGAGISFGCQRATDQFNVNLEGYTTRCIDGVEYIVFSTGASVKYETDGGISTCASLRN